MVADIVLILTEYAMKYKYDASAVLSGLIKDTQYVVVVLPV